MCDVVRNSRSKEAAAATTMATAGSVIFIISIMTALFVFLEFFGAVVKGLHSQREELSCKYKCFELISLTKD